MSITYMELYKSFEKPSQDLNMFFFKKKKKFPQNTSLYVFLIVSFIACFNVSICKFVDILFNKMSQVE